MSHPLWVIVVRIACIVIEEWSTDSMKAVVDQSTTLPSADDLVGDLPIHINEARRAVLEHALQKFEDLPAEQWKGALPISCIAQRVCVLVAFKLAQ